MVYYINIYNIDQRPFQNVKTAFNKIPVTCSFGDHLGHNNGHVWNDTNFITRLRALMSLEYSTLKLFDD